MKSYTDLEQSRKLAEILPLESADMRIGNYVGKSGKVDETNVHYYPKGESFGAPEIIYAWSLAALLSLIPQEIFDGEYIINITEGCYNRWVLTYDHYENRNHSYYGLSTGADNLIDACYELILKLNELNLL